MIGMSNINMIIPLTVPSGFSFHSLTKKPASRERLFGALAADGIPVALLILAVFPLFITDPGVQESINQVDHEIDPHHHGGEKQVDSLDRRVVSALE